MEHIIEIDHLTKDYGQGRGVFDVSFFVDKGEIFGFLGPNGAGKSTTIRHLMGFSRPDSGKTLLNGHESNKERDIIMKKVAYVPGEIALPKNLKGKEVIQIQKELKGVCDDSFLTYLKEYFQLDDNLYCKEMSLGMKRKMAIVSAFMSDPDVIILDEPSSGLDPEMQERFIALLKEEKKRGKTILLSSHIFEEVDACCDRIAVIKDGKIVSLFHADDLKHNKIKRYVITYETEEKRDNAIKRLEENGFHSEKVEKEKLIVTVDDDLINKFISSLEKNFLDFEEKKESLEDYFMSFYKEDLKYRGISQ